jgi:hypothetical protein
MAFSTSKVNYNTQGTADSYQGLTLAVIKRHCHKVNMIPVVFAGTSRC